MADPHPSSSSIGENGVPSAGSNASSLPAAGNGSDTGEEEMWFVDEDVSATSDWKKQSRNKTLPPLDLNELWQNVMNKSDGEATKKKTDILCAELQQYLFSQEAPKGKNKPALNPSAHPMFGATEEERVAAAKKQFESEAEGKKDEGDSNDESDEEERRTFADPFLFKLRFENKRQKRDVPHQSPADLLELVNNTFSNVKKIQADHEDIFHSFITAFGLEMTPYIFGRLLEALEKGREEMVAACRSFLYFISDHADAGSANMPRIMKQVVAKIAPDNWEGSAFYSLCEFMEMWARLLKRKDERALDVYDAFMLQERSVLCVENYITAFALEDDSEDPGGLKMRLPTIMVRLTEDLLKRQADEWEENKYLQGAVTKDGRVRKPRVISVRRKDISTIFYFDLNEEEASEKKAGMVNPEGLQKSPENAVVDDWLLTRKYLLSWAFSATKYIFRYFPCPSFENDGKLEYSLENGGVETVSNIVELLDSLWNVFKLVGWQNPVRCLQRADEMMSLDSTLKCADEMVGNKLEPTVVYCRNTKSLGYSMSAIAAYLFLALRVKGKKGPSAMFGMSLEGTGLDLLDPMYAFNVCLPYIMTLMQHSSEAMAMVGVRIADMLVDRFKRNWTAAEALHLACGDSADGVDVSVYGFLENLGKAFEARNAPDRMMFTFKTLKKCVAKIDCPNVRFSVVSKLLLSSKRTQIAAQYVTLLKDVLVYANKNVMAADDKKAMLAMTDNLRTQFVEIVFPKYFTPRKDYLSLMDPIVSTCAAAYYIAACDKAWFTKSSDDAMWLTPGLARRKKFAREYMNVGRECIRAVAATSEYDIKSIPKAKLKKHDCSTHKSIYDAAQQSLNNSVSSISMLATALDVYKEVTLDATM